MTDETDFVLERLSSPHENFTKLYLKRGSTTVGRTTTNTIVCNSGFVSRKHCVITVTESNQVMVKNERVSLFSKLLVQK